MIVNATNAEKKLLDDLNYNKHHFSTLKYFFIPFSKTTLPKDELMEEFLKLLDGFPNAYLANVYLCADYDVFIGMTGIMQRHFFEFTKQLSDQFQYPELIDLIETYEIGIHLDVIENICLAKLDNINTLEENKEADKKRNIAIQSVMQAMSKINTDMIFNIAYERKSRKNPTILIVEDDQLSRTLISNILDNSYDLVFAKNGQQALHDYITVAPDVCFLDIGLPDIDGNKILEILTQIDDNAYIIMISGRKEKNNIMRALKNGAQGFIGKPFTKVELNHYISASPFIMEKIEHNPSGHKQYS